MSDGVFLGLEAQKSVRTWGARTSHGRQNLCDTGLGTQGYGNLMLMPEQHAAFVEELPEVFVHIADGWGRMGATHIRLATVSQDVLAGALRTA